MNSESTTRHSDVRGPDLRTWIRDDLRTLRHRFDDGIVARVPPSRWREQPGCSHVSETPQPASSLAWLMLHMTYHHDIAVQCAVRNREPLMTAWRGQLGLTDVSPVAGLSEREDRTVTELVALDALVPYVHAVFAETERWLARMAVTALATIPRSSSRLATKAGVEVDAAPWLHAMWTAKPVSWFVQWEVIGHGHTHLGEMTAVRNQLGLSPF